MRHVVVDGPLRPLPDRAIHKIGVDYRMEFGQQSMAAAFAGMFTAQLRRRDHRILEVDQSWLEDMFSRPLSHLDDWARTAGTVAARGTTPLVSGGTVGEATVFRTATTLGGLAQTVWEDGPCVAVIPWSPRYEGTSRATVDWAGQHGPDLPAAPIDSTHDPMRAVLVKGVSRRFRALAFHNTREGEPKTVWMPLREFEILYGVRAITAFGVSF